MQFEVEKNDTVKSILFKFVKQSYLEIPGKTKVFDLLLVG